MKWFALNARKTCDGIPTHELVTATFGSATDVILRKAFEIKVSFKKQKRRYMMFVQ